MPWYDITLLTGFIASTLYVIIAEDNYLSRLGLVTNNLEVALGLIATIVTFEVSRRVTSLSYLFVGAIFVLYAIFSDYVPGFFRASGAGLSELTGSIWLSEAGLFGTMTSVLIEYLFLFYFFPLLFNILAGEHFFKDFHSSCSAK